MKNEEGRMKKEEYEKSAGIVLISALFLWKNP